MEQKKLYRVYRLFDKRVSIAHSRNTPLLMRGNSRERKPSCIAGVNTLASMACVGIARTSSGGIGNVGSMCIAPGVMLLDLLH